MFYSIVTICTPIRTYKAEFLCFYVPVPLSLRNCNLDVANIFPGIIGSTWTGFEIGGTLTKIKFGGFRMLFSALAQGVKVWVILCDNFLRYSCWLVNFRSGQIWTKLCMQDPYPLGKLYLGKSWDQACRNDNAQCNQNPYLLWRAEWAEVGWARSGQLEMFL